jgi:hypothetical protein
VNRLWIILFILPGQLLSAAPFEELPALKQFSTEQRIYFWTNHFIGTSYGKGGPLGEGSAGRFDQDPLYRFDKFDCTTFVETITALSLSNNKNDFINQMNKLRYKNGEVSYQTRNHITSLQWIPENIESGYYQDLTTTFPTSMHRSIQNNINMPNWFKAHDIDRLKLPSLSKRKIKRRLRELKNDISKEFHITEVKLDYLSIKEVLNNWDSFEDSFDGVYVVNIVRPNWNLVYKIGTRINISHQGILLKKNGIPTMIHASTTGQVVQVSLKKYLGWFKDSSTIKGINLLKVLN